MASESLMPFIPRHRAAVAVLAIAVSSVAGCAASPGASGGSTDAQPTSSETPTRTFEAVPESSASADAIPPDMLERVVADAADGAGVEPADVEVLIAEAVTWNDGSLGCPEPGMMYTQALVPGYRVVLDVDGDRLYFHSDSSGEFHFCDNPVPGGAGDGSR